MKLQTTTRILIVDDDPIVADSLAEFLSQEGYVTATAGDGNEALDILDQANGGSNGSGGYGTFSESDLSEISDAHSRNGNDESSYGLVIADMNMPRCDGMELLKTIAKKHDSTAVIMVTGYGKIETAVEAIKVGAVDYLTKPVLDDELRISVGRAMQQHALLAENKTLRDQLSQRYGMDNLVGADYRMLKIYDMIEAVAESKTTVLIEGESGTGKSMVGRAIHAHSPRRTGPFVTFSCGAIPETLLESELFGHVKGAFTGADYDKPGKIVTADGGTLLIDEINSATPALQLKLLRVLQERQFEPVGSTDTIQVDVRFVLATNQSLSDLVARGEFREDLFYRINVVNMQMPALRGLLSDIPLFVDHFMDKYVRETGKNRRFSEEAIEALKCYHWPGNVRELENAVERAVVLSRHPVIDVTDLPDTIRSSSGHPTTKPHDGAASGKILIPALEGGWTPTPLGEALAEPERQIILAALEANNWNRQATAGQLNINRTTLYKKIKQYRLEVPQ